MKRYVTRLLLNGKPTSEQYEKLHVEMKKLGFTRIIKSRKQQFFWLPDGTYVRNSKRTRLQVLADAKQAASTVSKKFEVLVSEVLTSSFDGLREATSKDAKSH